ncbi:MAG: glycosyltransferase family 4 protein [Candidatus Peregrinibacteria bacterium]
MRILLLNDDSLPSARGGAAVMVDLLRSAYARRGHDVTLITTHQNTHQEQHRTDEVGPIISLPISPPSRQRHRWIIDQPQIDGQLRGLLEKHRPDVVHAHNVHQCLTYGSLRVARSFTPRLFLTAHDTFLVSFERVNQEAYLHAAIQEKPFTMHWWHHALGAGRKYWPPRNAAIRRVLRQTGTTVISISRALQDFLRANGIESPVVIPNGITIPPAPEKDRTETLRRKWGLNGPTLLCGGRINADKGVLALLAAWKLVLRSLPTARLVIVGNTEGLFAHEPDAALKASLCLPGWIPNSSMPEVYGAADAVATPSIYLDAFNLVTIEAMAAAKPVIGSVFGGIPEIVVHGKTGWVADPRDTPALAEAILAALEHPVPAQEMGRMGRQRALELFSIDACAGHYLSLFETTGNREAALTG